MPATHTTVLFCVSQNVEEEKTNRSLIKRSQLLAKVNRVLLRSSAVYHGGCNLGRIRYTGLLPSEWADQSNPMCCIIAMGTSAICHNIGHVAHV